MNNMGISPRLKKEFTQRDKGMVGDFTFEIKCDAPAAGTAFDAITVRIKAVSASGDCHSWFNKTITTTALAVVTAGNGTAVQVPATTCVMKNGQGTVVVTGSDTWAAGDTFTVETAELSLMGYTIAAVSKEVTCV